jgi:hypothetical protein
MEVISMVDAVLHARVCEVREEATELVGNRIERTGCSYFACTRDLARG